MSKESLLKKKEAIDDAKTQYAEAKGKTESVEDQIFKKFKVKTIASANKELSKREDELDQMEKSLEEEETQLEEDYNWSD